MSNDEQTVTGQQDKVINAMLSGQTQRAAAEAAGVAPESVSRWLASDAVFVAELHARRAQLWDANRDKLADLASEAIDTVCKLMRSGDTDALRLRAALAIWKAQGFADGARPDGETDAGRIEKAWRKRDNPWSLDL